MRVPAPYPGMLDTDFDSFLTGAFGPTILLHLSQDRILAANQEAEALLGDDALTGSHFARFVAAGMEAFVVFITEAQYRGTAWTRQVTLQSADQTPLQCEVTGRAVYHDGQNMLLLHMLDL